MTECPSTDQDDIVRDPTSRVSESEARVGAVSVDTWTCREADEAKMSPGGTFRMQTERMRYLTPKLRLGLVPQR